jgi:serine/threonine-protein kinase SRPK3
LVSATCSVSSTSPQLPTGFKRFDESVISIRIRDEDDGDNETFMCDEEPHILSPKSGLGYNLLSLRQLLQDGKLEIVRKIGWASNSSVWLTQSVSG